MENDIVIGCIYGYEYSDIEPWVVSLERSGYSGKVALLVFKGSDALLKKLEEKDIYAIAFSNADVSVGIMSMRFQAMHHFLKTDPFFKNVKRIITTDVKDVIFQGNPSDLLMDGKYIIVGYEGFTYDVEPWSKNNMKLAFGEVAFEFMKNVPITCAGVIAGGAESMKNLFQQIYILCQDSEYPNQVPGGGGPDQSALNIILQNPKWKPFVIHTEKILHVGTSLAGISTGAGAIGESIYRLGGNPQQAFNYYADQFKLASMPQLAGEAGGLIVNAGHQADQYVIVHQYDRIPSWKTILQNKYKE